MSIPVDLEGLRQQVEGFGPVAFLLSAGSDGRPHCVQLSVALSDRGLFEVRPGRGTRANLAAQPLVSLLWPRVEPGGYSLIVDGTAHGADDSVTIEPTKAVLHRAAHPDDRDSAAHGSDCVRVFASPAST